MRTCSFKCPSCGLYIPTVKTKFVNGTKYRYKACDKCKMNYIIKVVNNSEILMHDYQQNKFFKFK